MLFWIKLISICLRTEFYNIFQKQFLEESIKINEQAKYRLDEGREHALVTV